MKKEENEALFLLQEKRQELKRRLSDIENAISLIRAGSKSNEDRSRSGGPTASDVVKDVLTLAIRPMTVAEISNQTASRGSGMINKGAVHTALTRLKAKGDVAKVSEGPPATWATASTAGTADGPSVLVPSFGQSRTVQPGSS
ncbi:MAG: hypothetical protein OXH76_09090 [Boseongicola sp.]|nr:hypothetical protein [Boseongicola sp.]